MRTVEINVGQHVIRILFHDDGVKPVEYAKKESQGKPSLWDDSKLGKWERGVEIRSSMHESCYCGAEYCHHEDSPRDYNIALDGIESFLLALAVEGVDVQTPQFAQAIQVALDAIENKFDT